MPKRKSQHERLYLTAAQCRAVDGYAMNTLGVAGVVLMENAGRNAAALIAKWSKRGPVSIVCGRGNNGGDGFVIARYLAMRGFEVGIDVLGEPDGLSPDAAVNCSIARNMNLPVRQMATPRAIAAAVRRWRLSNVIVDALLGTGFTGKVREPLAGVIRRINRLDGPLIVAVDVPSGLSADTGRPGGLAVKAHRTVTFLAPKTGFARPSAKPYVGHVSVVDIGAPLDLILAKLQA